jgi:PPOX class probable F420-dependent enzyme
MVTTLSTLDQKTIDFLREKRFAVMATINKDGTPQQTVMWYDLRGDRIMMNTAAGRVKEGNLQRDPRISLCIEDGYKYVTIKGKVELDYDQDRAQADIKALAIRYKGEDEGEQMARNTFSKQERITLYMSIDQVDTHF